MNKRWSEIPLNTVLLPIGADQLDINKRIPVHVPKLVSLYMENVFWLSGATGLFIFILGQCITSQKLWWHTSGKMTIKFTDYLKDSRPAVGFSLDKLRLIALTDRKLWLEYQVYEEDEECHAKTWYKSRNGKSVFMQSIVLWKYHHRLNFCSTKSCRKSTVEWAICSESVCSDSE